jgi:AcrR family transcriptional regulator
MPHTVDHAPQDLGRRERRKLELRNRILEASIELFRDRGVSDTTVNDISERADVAQKTFFNHFPSKQHLLREIAHYSLGELLLDIEQVCKQPISSRERIHRFFETLADNADEAGPMQRELLTEIVHIAHQSGTEPEQARQLQAAFGAIVERGLALGDLIEGHSPETLTETLMGTFYVLMFNWANLDGYSFRDHAMAMAHFLADSMTNDHAGSGVDAGSDEGGLEA